ncbi:hypothetical protein [Streptomyces sp. NBC_00576]|uniref:hypothetical protein n=1 Tax=Streptomyces sp. NBC_00576 TaxID=2903665 RepID=UPI002E81149A|nr:hypothetical protein [Streptomyces sp. NBC_00576]WUB77654.1 hypothetical protein OG734_21365 [Streptomyces sp. NBC_00576]
MDTNAWYVMVNRNSGKALDDGTNQQFQFVACGDGYIKMPYRMGLLTQTNSPC